MHTVSKIVNADFSAHTKLKATVHGSEWGGYGSGLGVKLFIKHGNAYTFTDSGWTTIGKSGQGPFQTARRQISRQRF